MKGAIRQMKQKYSTAVASRKLKTEDSRDKKMGKGADGDDGMKTKLSKLQHPVHKSSERDQQVRTVSASSSSNRVKSNVVSTKPRFMIKKSKDQGSGRRHHRRPPTTSRSFESFDSSHVSFASPLQTYDRAHRGRSPCVRPAFVSRDEITEIRNRVSYSVGSDGESCSTSSSYTSYDSEEGSSWISTSSRSNSVVSIDQTEDDDYSQNRLRDIGKVIRAPDCRDDLEDDVDEDENNEEGATTDEEDETNTVTDKSLDSAEENEFQEYLKHENERKKGGGFFWMLGFGHSNDVDDENATVGDTSPSVGETVEDDVSTQGENVQDESVAHEDDDMTSLANDDDDITHASTGALLKNKSVETARIKSGCFINILSSGDSIDGSYGGLRDGDILVAESFKSHGSGYMRGSHSFDETYRTDVNDEGDDDDEVGTEMASHAEQTIVFSVATETKEKAGEDENSQRDSASGNDEVRVLTPFSLFSWLMTDHSIGNEIFSNNGRNEESLQMGEKNSTTASVPIDETVVMHTLVESQSVQTRVEHKLDQILTSNEEELSCGDTTINTDQHSVVGIEEKSKAVNSCEKSEPSASAVFVPSMVGSASSQAQESSPGHSTEATSQNISSNESLDGHTRKLVVSCHRRGNAVHNSSSDQAKSQNDQGSMATCSEISYKEEFELELGPYNASSNDPEATSGSSDNSGYEEGPKRKKAECLDNYDISEIVHGRRKFMPKPRALEDAYIHRNELGNSSTGVHPCSVSTAGVRRARRRSALKAHRDFLYKAHGSIQCSESETKTIDDPIEEQLVVNPFPSTEQVESEEKTLEGNNSIQRAQPSGEWIEKAWQPFGIEEIVQYSSNSERDRPERSTRTENSIADDINEVATDVQKAGALVDRVCTALKSILSGDEVVTNESKCCIEQTDGKQDKNTEECINGVPDVFQAAFDFFGMVKKQEAVATLTDIEEDLNGSVLRFASFNPNPRCRINTELCKEDREEHDTNAAKSSSSTSHQVEENATESSRDMTTNSDAAVLDLSCSKEAGETNEENGQRFNVDGIPLELRPRKIWKTFENVDNGTTNVAAVPEPQRTITTDLNSNMQGCSEVVAGKNEQRSVDIDFVSCNEESEKAASNDGSDVNQSESKKNDQFQRIKRLPKNIEILRLTSRRFRHVSRVTGKREEKESVKESNHSPVVAPNCSTSMSDKKVSPPTLPYSGEATVYRKHVNDIRSRLRQRRQSKVFQQTEKNLEKTSEKVDIQSPKATIPPFEQRDDSSNNDEFYDANTFEADERKPNDDSSAENRILREEEQSQAATFSRLQYEFVADNKTIIKNSIGDDDLGSLSIRSKGSMYSAFSLD